MARSAPYGSWSSPITAELAAGAAVSFHGLTIDGADLFWLEQRPTEAGRTAIMQRTSNGDVIERLAKSYSARSTVHEYGGGALAVHDGTVYFVNASDQQIYKQSPGTAPAAISHHAAERYGDLALDARRGRILCVAEDHSAPGEPSNAIAAVDIDGAGQRTLVEGNDFYSNPRLNPDGSRLAFLTWNHPNMPWEGCELHLAALDAAGTIVSDQLVAGGPSESILQPEWSPDGVLHFVSDSSGWWNIYRWHSGVRQALCPMEAEFGQPLWVLGAATYGFVSPDRILCCYSQAGIDHLAWIAVDDRKLIPIEQPYTRIELVRCSPDTAAFVGGAPARPSAIVSLISGAEEPQVIQEASRQPYDELHIASPQSVEWAAPRGGRAYGLFYPPTNAGYTCPAEEKPPLIVWAHSGPTSAASTALRLPLQYWTSRGIAVLDVNYAGSTGYGRVYRSSLQGQWGVVDVEDCRAGAQYLVDRGLVDGKRLAIKGSSAGGFTALSCLVADSATFKAGIVQYAIADLEAISGGTHKFEAHYHEWLVGPEAGSGGAYRERSPIQHVDRLSSALLFLHGAEDNIVPPAQSQLMFDAVRRRGLPTALIVFADEGHGFRRSETRKRALEAELYFLSRVFGFVLPEPVQPISIANLASVT